MKYLDYSKMDPILHIKAPILQNNYYCKIESKFEYIMEGQEWSSSEFGDNNFRISFECDFKAKEIKVNSVFLSNKIGLQKYYK